VKETLFIIAVVFTCLIVSCNQSERGGYILTANPESSTRTVNLYHFIQDIQGKFILSGQHNFAGKGSLYSDQLEAITGLKAIVWGSDFSFCVEGSDAMRYQHCGPANLPAFDTDLTREDRRSREPEFLNITLEEARELTIREILKKHEEGHIITLMWHNCFPTDGDCCDGSSIWAMENRPSPREWEALVTEGTELNRAWKEGADKIAGYLMQLRDADIPVLWRPYHEMNGVWFWWCNQKGEQGFKRLWIMMYDYFTNHHQLNNLLWVWNTNAPRDIPGDEAWNYADFFPGLEYVDILAADVYRNDYKQSHHDQLVGLAGGKPIALGEMGQIPTRGILEEQPGWTWFMPWGWILFYSNDAGDIRELYQSDLVLTMDEVTVDHRGKYTLRTKVPGEIQKTR
jgi:mannan endo-1,4-beta-mannosidase